MSPRWLYLALAAPDARLLPFMLVAVARLGVADPFHFGLGRAAGQACTDRWCRGGRVLARAKSAVKTCGPLAVALRPSGVVLAAAGAGRMRPGVVIVADLVGTVMQVFAVYRCGHAFAPVGTPMFLPSIGPLVALSVGAASLARAKSGRPGARRDGSLRRLKVRAALG